MYENLIAAHAALDRLRHPDQDWVECETLDFDGDGVTDYAFNDRDFNVRSLVGNAVLRWELTETEPGEWPGVNTTSPFIPNSSSG